MGRYITQAPRVKKQQVFTVSGIFTPSPGLLAAGGVVEVRCVGGGGPGGRSQTPNGSSTHYMGGGGGSGADITRIVQVTGNVTVVVGAGGTSPPHPGVPADGGTTSFGDLIHASGGKPAGFSGGAAGGLGGYSGHNAVPSPAPQSSSYAGPGGGAGGWPPAPNSGGGGGGGNHSGASGICIVTWEE